MTRQFTERLGCCCSGGPAGPLRIGHSLCQLRRSSKIQCPSSCWQREQSSTRKPDNNKLESPVESPAKTSTCADGSCCFDTSRADVLTRTDAWTPARAGGTLLRANGTARRRRRKRALFRDGKAPLFRCAHRLPGRCPEPTALLHFRAAKEPSGPGPPGPPRECPRLAAPLRAAPPHGCWRGRWSIEALPRMGLAPSALVPFDG